MTIPRRDPLRWLATLLITSLLAAGCVMQEEPTRVPTHPPSPTPAPTTPPPTPVPTLTELPPASVQPAPDEQLLYELQEEMLVSWVTPIIGGSGEGPPEGAKLPAMEWFQGQGLTGMLTLWGFREGDEVAVEIRDPAGGLAGARSFSPSVYVEGPTVVEIPLTLASLPSGAWKLMATSPTARLKAAFEVKPAELPALYVVRRAGPDIFAVGAPEFAAGDVLSVVGAGLPPGRSLPLGIYASREEDLMQERLTLVYAAAVRTDGDGGLETRLEVEASDPPGLYYALLPLEPGYEPGGFVGAQDPTGAVASFRIAAR